jgi:hypothetical protein
LAEGTESGFDGLGLGGGSSFLVFSIVGPGTGVGFAAGFVDEHPNKKKAEKINIKIFKTKRSEKYFINFRVPFPSPSLLLIKILGLTQICPPLVFFLQA